jgi:hypothetical protein
MVDGEPQSGTGATQDQPSDEEMRAAYEAELSRITSSEMILQTTVSLLNIGGRRLGMAPAPAGSTAAREGERDLEQVRDAIDGASALLAILERRMPRELGPLRDALAQLQVAYAREAQSPARSTSTAAHGYSTEQQPTFEEKQDKQTQDAANHAENAGNQAENAAKRGGDAAKRAENAGKQGGDAAKQGGKGDKGQEPGPAQASGRLWVPGR